MSDLISRSELIKELNKYCGNQRYLVSENIREIINNQPTAYDIDKVVEKLEERARTVNVIGYGTIYEAINKDVAIEIVKRRGVDYDVCEWNQIKCGVGLKTYKISCFGKTLEMPVSTARGLKYCPYCGKKIKIVGD